MEGDKNKFCLSLQCVAEFAMKYCRDGLIDIAVDVGKVRADKKLEITIQILITKNGNNQGNDN